MDTIPAAQQPQPPASDGSTGVYGITVAAELAGMSVQALRLYERKGLLAPARTGGGVRRYSDADIARLRRIGTLIAEGINLIGIARVLGLEADTADLHADNSSTATGDHPPGEPAHPRDVTSMFSRNAAARHVPTPGPSGNCGRVWARRGWFLDPGGAVSELR